MNDHSATIFIAGSDEPTKNVLIKGDEMKEKGLLYMYVEDLLNFAELSRKSTKS